MMKEWKSCILNFTLFSEIAKICFNILLQLHQSENIFDEIATVWMFCSSFLQSSFLSLDKFEEGKQGRKFQQIHFSTATAEASKHCQIIWRHFVKNRKRKILNVISRVFGWPRGWQHFALQQLIVAGSNLEAANAALKLLHHRS